VTRIVVQGLREFQQAIDQMDAELVKQMRGAFVEAGGVVIDYATGHMPRKSGAAAASLKARAGQRDLKLSMGGRKAAYAPWLDFGGEGKRKGRPPARPYIRGGRYLYKGLEVRRADIAEIMIGALTKLAHDAGLEVH
jgi:hypothetical protein